MGALCDLAMRIVHVSVYEDSGGAPRAAKRLSDGLRLAGCDSRMYVLHRDGESGSTVQYIPPRTVLHRILHRWRTRAISRSRRPYDITGGWMYDEERSPFGADSSTRLQDCDVIHLHWVARFVDVRHFFRRFGGRRPIVWTLHDMNAFTGGCYFDSGCGRHRVQCGACPRLGSQDVRDLSASVWARKNETYSQLSPGALCVVAPSKWLAGEASSSALLGRFPIKVIPYGLDTELFSPVDRLAARAALRIPFDARVILFLAHGVGIERKGMSYLVSALERLRTVPGLFLLSVGAGEPQLPAGVASKHLGLIESEWMLPVVYSAADVFALPSLQDNLPNVMLEAMACGLPVTGFACGGIAETIRNGVNGFTVPVADSDGLANAMRRLLEDERFCSEASRNAREDMLRHFTLRRQAEQYLVLYNELIAKQARSLN
jgi:glycosyltransferase involved in cell wall biosynthesis